MQLVILIILIPLCSVGFFIYLNALMNYAFYNVLNTPQFTGGIIACLILGFIIFHLLGSVRPLSASKLNYESKVIPYFSYYSFTILLLFGISLIINSITNEVNVFTVFAGCGIIILFLYITTVYMIIRKKEVFTLVSIDEIEEDDLKYPKEDEEEDENKEEELELPKMKDKKNPNVVNRKTVKCLTFENEDIGLIEYYVDDHHYEADKKYTVIYNPKLKVIYKILNEVNVIE